MGICCDFIDSNTRNAQQVGKSTRPTVFDYLPFPKPVVLPKNHVRFSYEFSVDQSAPIGNAVTDVCRKLFSVRNGYSRIVPPLQGCVKPGLTSYDHRFTSYRCRRRISDRLGSDRPSIRFEALVAIWTASSRIGLSSNCKNGFIRIPLPTIHPLAIRQGYCSGV